MINVVVAFQPEASALIEKWKLKKQQGTSPFPVYRNDQTQLIICGLGKCNSAAATSWLAAKNNSHEHAVWVNLGIAGHKDIATGTLVSVNKLTDHATGKSWYPTHIRNKITQHSAITVDTPQTQYATDNIYEMEASGFYPTALRFSTSELVHCLKVISDNQANPIQNITPQIVRELMQGNLEHIESYCTKLHELAAECEYVDTTQVELQFQQHIPFTVTQQHMLRRLLLRHLAVFGHINAYTSELADLAGDKRNINLIFEILAKKIDTGTAQQ